MQYLGAPTSSHCNDTYKGCCTWAPGNRIAREVRAAGPFPAERHRHHRAPSGPSSGTGVPRKRRDARHLGATTEDHTLPGPCRCSRTGTASRARDTRQQCGRNRGRGWRAIWRYRQRHLGIIVSGQGSTLGPGHCFAIPQMSPATLPPPLDNGTIHVCRSRKMSNFVVPNFVNPCHCVIKQAMQ